MTNNLPAEGNIVNHKAKLTIVLTLKDRAAFTYRWMQYMNGMRCPFKIIIADGGKDSALERHLRDTANYPHLDYEYVRYPYDATIGDYYKKFENVLSLVKSEYMLLADNDDFYLLERVPDIIDFLDQHKDYVGARGKLVYLSLYNRGGTSNALAKGIRYLAYTKEAVSIENASSCERVETLCGNMTTNDYYTNWYCIFRSRQFQDIWKYLVTLPIKEVIVTEMLTHVFIVMSGKIKIFSFLFYIRQSSTSMSGDNLVVGNEFLERCLINNGLSEFRSGIDHFFVSSTREERDRLLRALAGWLEIFVSNIYVARTTRKNGIVVRVRNKMKRFVLSKYGLAINYHHLLYFLLPFRRSKPVRLKVLEPYICTQSCLDMEARTRYHGN